MLIPHKELEPETLQSLIEEFVTREGTDYGEREYSLSEKVEHVRRQLDDQHIFIVFSQEDQSVSIMPREQLSNTEIRELEEDYDPH